MTKQKSDNCDKIIDIKFSAHDAFLE